MVFEITFKVSGPLSKNVFFENFVEFPWWAESSKSRPGTAEFIKKTSRGAINYEFTDRSLIGSFIVHTRQVK